ncbi:DUF1289 domain-containing protein [Amphritea sp. 1_MG-2023]|uniref:DUF1289 domain-containing protein n=1 Tax=Amphritea sp. 1_MG-2023 TaxID=3062670 RepID=UPI0026E2A0D6|nr:DUF1289 domain-containing protein [Amphritea sp. 1_MG-2023]MDO6564472.1 DUF1289 domain-containing protein [Amphritea sp. 1_MG-2023]
MKTPVNPPFRALSVSSQTPCIRNCCLDKQNTCLGCFRTLEEILAWHGANNVEKAAILKRCQQRRLSQ